MTHSVSTFFTADSAPLDGKRVEAVAVVISDEGGAQPVLRMVVVNEEGATSLVAAERLDMYGAYEDGTPEEAAEEGPEHPTLGD